ncbi:hypothetical protein N0V94_005715 [Neodidymelliopsis sp. IMI 364377]|nr:hypothetical protein N0V94_005715 [Neodidymelliopsis sp. IMI 364377]
MPRQLPWKSGGGSRTQTVKPPSRTVRTPRIPDDVDDDFFDSTVLTSSGKGKGKAKATSDSEDSLPELLTGLSTSESKTKNAHPNERAPSSSPPPLSDYALPYAEPMRKGTSKFDLQDDEWMMVEDEFLETAKLFTRHLHIAEYDRLKESIEAKKKEAEISRPVVAGAKRSVEGTMKEKAKVQNSKQKRAIRDVFASQGDQSEDDRALYRVTPSKPTSATAKSLSITIRSPDTNSDDLDAPRIPNPKTPAQAPVTATKSSPAVSHVSKPSMSSFAKPALPTTTAAARPRAPTSRIRRATPFDMLDEYTPPKLDQSAPQPNNIHRTQASTSSKLHSQPISSPLPVSSSSQTARALKSRKSLDLLDDWGTEKTTSGASTDVADRLAKRKAEREKGGDGSGKRRAANLDDIPTFLF